MNVCHNHIQQLFSKLCDRQLRFRGNSSFGTPVADPNGAAADVASCLSPFPSLPNPSAALCASNGGGIYNPNFTLANSQSTGFALFFTNPGETPQVAALNDTLINMCEGEHYQLSLYRTFISYKGRSQIAGKAHSQHVMLCCPVPGNEACNVHSLDLCCLIHVWPDAHGVTCPHPYMRTAVVM